MKEKRTKGLVGDAKFKISLFARVQFAGLGRLPRGGAAGSDYKVPGLNFFGWERSLGGPASIPMGCAVFGSREGANIVCGFADTAIDLLIGFFPYVLI